jgi:hypothetical protein
MADILVQGTQLDGHGNVWFALHVAPAAKGGFLHILCYYSVKATRNDDGPKNNMGQDVAQFDERWSMVSLQGYLNGESRFNRSSVKFGQETLVWQEDIRLEASLAAAIVVLRDNKWADPTDWKLQLAFTPDE